MDEYRSALDAIRQLREWGATSVCVGAVSATFPEARPELVGLPLEEEDTIDAALTAEELARRNRIEEQKLQYWSAGG